MHEAQLISVVEDIKLAMDCFTQTDIIFIDFRKAFDWTLKGPDLRANETRFRDFENLMPVGGYFSLL